MGQDGVEGAVAGGGLVVGELGRRVAEEFLETAAADVDVEAEDPSRLSSENSSQPG
jgi:hypothetical protein